MTNGREENRELFEDNISEKVTHNQEGNESSYNKDDDSLSLTSEEQPSKVSESNIKEVALTFTRVHFYSWQLSSLFTSHKIFNEYAEKDQGRGFSGGQ